MNCSKSDRRFVVACNPYRRMVVGQAMPEQIAEPHIIKSLTYNQAKSLAKSEKYRDARVCELVEVKEDPERMSG